MSTEIKHTGDEASDAHVLVVTDGSEEEIEYIDDLTPVTTLADMQDGELQESEDTERRPPREQRESKRVPLGSQGPLYLAKKHKDPQYVERFVNDKPGRIESFRKAGWQMVCVSKENRVVGDPHCGKGTKIGTPVSVSVGDNETAYLMRIKREWYDEDQKDKKKRILDMEDEMRNQPTKEGQYGEVKF
ncbi:MAG: hypothetical protein ACYTFW_26790 [Planctomycetota bacterium]